MEKAKKCQKENQVKILNKKSKGTINSKKWLQQTKESFGNKSMIRKSVSGHKKDKKEMLLKASSVNNIKANNINSRYLTQFLSNKVQKQKECKKQKLIVSNVMSPERTTANDAFRKSAKVRLSLNQTKNKGKTEQNKSTLGSELSFKDLNNHRKQIQSSIKKLCLKDTIQRKDLLKITNEYERLIDRFIFTELAIEPSEPSEDLRISSYDYQQAQTFRVNEDYCKGKDKICLGLQLQNIRNMNINDYHDQFMSHYDELSQSWKRDLQKQKRF